MIYPSTLENKLGFDRICSYLKESCVGPAGREKADGMSFSSDVTLIMSQLMTVNEMKEIILSPSTLPIESYNDIIPVLNRLRLPSSYPDIEEGFCILKILELIKRITSFFRNHEKQKYPILRKMSDAIGYDNTILESLQHIYEADGSISNNASPRLSEIRRELSEKQKEVSRRISRIMKEAQANEWADNELSPALRDGRLVIPVLAFHKRKIRGIIHDESASGKTVFIEPEEVVELNNDIRETEMAERREIISILTTFADSVRPSIDLMLSWYYFLGDLDFIRAKALFAVKTDSHLPSLENKPVIQWYDAKHPLLLLRLMQEGKSIVPHTISLDEKSRILVISGPNAGGKSVCLQTAGLLQYMLQCGMLIPVKPVSVTGIFTNIFIDIGDEQSIENDLSTYTSRLINMKFFLKHADNRTLILIDEFGTGTDPAIGGAIAESILQSLNEKRCFGIITTHYTNLKHFAMTAEGITNGAMLYDTAKLQPLFILRTGEPGSSFAFEIARKTGIPEEILKEAEKKAGSGTIEFDRNLREILRDKHYWERKRETIKENEKKLSEIIDRYEKELNDINRLRKQILDEAKKESERILSESNRKIENTIREIKEAQAEKEKTKMARKKLEELKKNITTIGAGKDEWFARKMEQIKHRKERQMKREAPIAERNKTVSTTTDEPLKPGDKVRFKEKPDVTAEITGIRKNIIQLAMGHLQITAKRHELEKISSNEYKRLSQSSSSAHYSTELSRKKLEFRQRIDVRGMRGDEALKEITVFIDEAIMVGVNEVSILHGKGNGILRELIRSYLKGIKEIESFSDAPVEQGGAGITEVRFK